MKGILAILMVSAVAVAADSTQINCELNTITKDLCAAVDTFDACAHGSSECDELLYFGSTMTASIFYVGKIDALATSLVSLGLYSGEVKEKVDGFSRKYQDGYAFSVLSQDRNFIAAANEMNRRIYDTARKWGKTK